MGLLCFEAVCRNTIGLAAAEQDLAAKMRQWNSLSNGDLPYIVGYATDRADFSVPAIDRDANSSPSIGEITISGIAGQSAFLMKMCVTIC